MSQLSISADLLFSIGFPEGTKLRTRAPRLRRGDGSWVTAYPDPTRPGSANPSYLNSPLYDDYTTCMKLRHAVLGLLSLEPQSGYDLGRAFAGSVAHFWYADQAQIYRLLDALESEGALTTEVFRQNSRPDRRVHSLTDTGREELDAWQRSPLDPQRPKNAFLARLFFAGSLGVTHVRRLLDEAEQLVTATHSRLRAVESSGSTLDDVVQVATLRSGIRHAEADLAWIAETREALTAFETAAADG